MKHLFRIGFGLVASSMILGCAQLPETDELVLVASDDVPEAISAEARDLAENSPLMIETLSEAKVVFIVTEVIRQKNGEDDPAVLYNVIHYRYDDDTAIHSRVNLEQNVILEQQEFPHLPTNFTPQELATAAEMALTDDRVRRALGDEIDNIEVEALAIRTYSEDDPWFGRRVLRLLFKDTGGKKAYGQPYGRGKGYLHEPVVIVDLTENVVTVEESGPMENTIELPIAEEEK